MKFDIAPSLMLFTFAALIGGCDGASRAGADPELPASASAAPAPDKAAQLNGLYADYWEEYLKLHPLAATFQGDPRYNDQLPNLLSEEYRQQEHDFTTRWLDRIEAVGTDGLEGRDRVSYKIFVLEAQDQLAGEKFPDWMQPVNQFYSLPNFAVQLGSGTGAQPFHTVEDYANWEKRASRIPTLFEQAIANMKEGVKAGVVQPTALMDDVVSQLGALIKDKPEGTLFWKPIASMPETFSDADRERITNEYRQMIEQQLMPAYRGLRDYIANDYMQHTRDTSGLGALPDGKAWYEYLVRHYTTTDLTPAEIHKIGVDNVAQIQREIQGVMDKVGFEGSMQDFFHYMRTDPRFTFDSQEDLLKYYRALEAKIYKKIPDLFTLTPKADFEIRPVEPYREKSAAGGSYMTPSEDGSRPGIFYVNTYDLPTRKTWDAEDLFLHEAIPGHHFQLALQQELTDLPDFRRFGGQTAFIEGWGLYTESLGKELGVYETPYDYFGYLQNSLWRAIRLVVDTGLHSMGWTREQVIDYMLENSAESKTQATAEAERYMAIPGQALAYKIGSMKIRELRDKAEQALGERFDIREFHAEVLKDGSLPLAILEAKIDRWIAGKK